MNNFISSLIGALLGSGAVTAWLNHRYSQKLWLYTERSKILIDLSPLLSDVTTACFHTLLNQQLAMEGKGSIEITDGIFNKAVAELRRFAEFVKKNGALLETDGLADRLRTLGTKYEQMLGLAAPPQELINLSPVELLNRMETDTFPLLKEIEQTIQRMLSGGWPLIPRSWPRRARSPVSGHR